jgi:hypothetical protein
MWLNKLAALRGPGESYSDVIFRIADQKQEATHDGSLGIGRHRCGVASLI